MKVAFVKIETRERPLRVASAESFAERLVGLCRNAVFPPCDALRLPRCRAVHTFAMRSAIDVVFVAGDRRIARVHRALPRGRVAVCLIASETWEFAAGAVDRLGLKCGDELRWPS